MKKHIYSIVIWLVILAFGGVIAYFIDWSSIGKEPELSASEKRRQEVLKLRSEALARMPREARSLMEYQKREYARAYRNAYKNLTPEEREHVKNVKLEIKKNSDEQKEYFNSLSESDQKVLRYPLNPNTTNSLELSTVDPRVLEKFHYYQKRREDLMLQIPEEVREVELPDDIKEEILEKGKKIEDDLMKKGTASN